ncbi:FAD-binding protein, partial [Sutterella massiliensis]
KTDDEDNILTKLLDRFARLNSPVYKADTIEALAKAAGINEAALVESVKTFNEAIAKGEGAKLTPPHNRRTPHPVATAPFYAIPMSGGIANTFGGPKINEKAEVVDLDDQPIKGLYAAGAAAGGLWYEEDIPGSQLSSGLVFGRIAARSARERAKENA